MADDIPIRDYVDRLVKDLDKHHSALRKADQEAVSAALTAADKAVETAKVASDEHLALHNGLIEEIREDRSTLAKKESVEYQRQQDDARMKRLESFQSKMLGGIVVIGAIGVGNFVKLLVG